MSHPWLIDSTEEDDYWRNISSQNWDGGENISSLCVCLPSIFASRLDEEHEDVKLQCSEEDVDVISSVLTWQWQPPVVQCDNGAEGNVHVAAFHYLGLCEKKKEKKSSDLKEIKKNKSWYEKKMLLSHSRQTKAGLKVGLQLVNKCWFGNV